MRDEQRILLQLLNEAPVRLTYDQVGCYLNCTAEVVPALVKDRLLRVLGDPPENGQKFISRDKMSEHRHKISLI